MQQFSAVARHTTSGSSRAYGAAAAVDQLTVEKVPHGVMLVAALRIGDRTVAIRRSGANLVAAYADLRLATPEPVLAAAFTLES